MQSKYKVFSKFLCLIQLNVSPSCNIEMRRGGVKCCCVRVVGSRLKLANSDQPVFDLSC